MTNSVIGKMRLSPSPVNKLLASPVILFEYNEYYDESKEPRYNRKGYCEELCKKVDQVHCFPCKEKHSFLSLNNKSHSYLALGI